MKMFRTAAVTILAVLAVATVAKAAWPEKPVRFVVPFAPGGSTDGIARLVAEKLSQALGQQFAVENVAGAGGLIGAQTVSAQPADGYTILFGTSTMSTIDVFYKDAKVNTLKDFKPVSLVSQGVLTLVVQPSLGLKSYKDFVEYAKKNPGAFNFGTPGPGVAHLTVEMLKHQSGIDVQVVPYKGAGPAMTALISGEIQGMMEPTITTKPQVDAGKIVALATSGAERSKTFPDKPTIAEAMNGRFEAAFYNGIFVKTGTPDDIVKKLGEEVAKVVKTPDVVDRLGSLGQQAVGSTPAEFRASLEKEIPQWVAVGKEAGIQPE